MSDNTTGLMAGVKNGVVNYTASSETLGDQKVRGSSELGKDAFLQLLVCQMQNQDPLEPSNDTEFVSQLAQFSSLEQLQNLSGESEKSQAFSLVGQYVTFEIKDTNGKTTYPEGVVDYVSMVGSKIKLSVNGTLYDYSDLQSVVDTEFYVSQNLPKIPAAYDFSYNAKSPENLIIEVDYGKDDYKASEVAIVIGGKPIDGSYLTYRNNTVTIDKKAFADMPNGEYPASIVFNNSLYTTVSDKLKITIFNSEVTPGADEAPAEEEAKG